MSGRVTPAEIARFRELGFSVSFPYNHDPALWDRLAPFAAAVEEIYAELHPSVFPSMRPWTGLPRPAPHLANLVRLQRQVRGHDIALCLILNVCPTPWVDERPLLRCLDRLRREGPVRVTVADFEWAGRLRAAYPDLSLGVSTVVEVDNQHAAMLWRDLVGVDTIVLGRRINKDPRRIREIRRLGLHIKMVVSDTCTDDCPLRMRHAALLAPPEANEARAATHADLMVACAEVKHRLPVWHLVKKTVLPFQLPRYRGLVDMVKLNDRRRSTAWNIDNLVRYLRMEEDVHPLFGYRESPETFDHLSRCRRTCARCTWCARHIEVLRPRSDLPLPAEVRAARRRP